MENVKDILGEGFGEKVLDYMKELAKGIGVAAEHVYVVFVKQQMIYGISEMIGFFMGLVLISLITWFGVKAMIKHSAWEASPVLVFPVGGIIGCLYGFFNGLMHTFNPEYYAIKEILNAIS